MKTILWKRSVWFHDLVSFIRYPNTVKTLKKKNEAEPRFLFHQIRSDWISGEKLFGVFDIAPQSINSSYREIQSKRLPNFDNYSITYPNLFLRL